jgi:hypothetical protein
MPAARRVETKEAMLYWAFAGGVLGGEWDGECEVVGVRGGWEGKMRTSEEGS